MGVKMNEEKNWFKKFSAFMDQNIRGVQYGIYSVAGLGLFLALRSVRPFAKFSFPSDIPKHFMDKKMPFVAKVKVVEPGRTVDINPVLLVDHEPLIALSKKLRNDGLPLEISSISITTHGFSWLQALLSNQKITFVPLRTTHEKVYCIVNNKSQNVGHQLVKIGFATVSPIDINLEKDQYYLKYYKSLLSAERKAESKGVGIWANSKVSFPRYLLNKLKRLLHFST